MRKILCLFIYITSYQADVLINDIASDIIASKTDNETHNLLGQTDSLIKNGVNLIEKVSSLPLNNFGKKVPDMLAPSSFPKEVSNFIANLSEEKVNEVYNKLKELPEGSLPSEVQSFLSRPELQDPKKLAAALKTMDVGPLTSLIHSIDKTNINRIAEETFASKNVIKEPIKILQSIANGKFEHAAKSGETYVTTIKRLLSPEGIATTFGDSVINRLEGKAKLDDEHITAISYELTQKGYSRSDIQKIINTLSEKISSAMKYTAEEQYDKASSAILEYEDMMKQFQINEIYNISELDAKKINDFAKRLYNSGSNPTHERVLSSEEEAEKNHLKQSVVSGNTLLASKSAASTISSVTNKIKAGLISELAAKLNITNPTLKKKLAAKIESNSDFNFLIECSTKAFQESLLKATECSSRGETELAAKYMAEAMSHLAFMQHPEQLAKIKDSILSDMLNGEYLKSLTEEEKNKKPESTITLDMIEYKPPEDKPIVIHETSSEVTREREIAAGIHEESYSMHEAVLGTHEHINAAKHNYKASKATEKHSNS